MNKTNKINKKHNETKPKKTTQTILDFCQRTPGRKRCPICQLEYQPTVQDDVKTHERFHKQYLSPISFKMKDFSELHKKEQLEIQ
jgi:N-acetyltransferase